MPAPTRPTGILLPTLLAISLLAGSARAEEAGVPASEPVPSEANDRSPAGSEANDRSPVGPEENDRSPAGSAESDRLEDAQESRAGAGAGPSTAIAGPRLALPSALFVTLSLAAEVNPRDWIAAHGIADVRRYRLPSERTLLSFPMDASRWSEIGKALCSEDGVAGCEVELCREFLVPGDARTDTSDPEGDEAATSEPNHAPVGTADAATPPVAAPAFGDDGSSPDDRGATLLAGRAERAGAGVAATRIALVPVPPDIRTLLGGVAPGAGSERAASELPGASSCALSSADGSALPLTALAGADGGFRFDRPDPSERFDPGCWEIVAADACAMRRKPLRDMTPEYEPLRLLILIAQAPRDELVAAAQGIVAGLGISVLDAWPLASIEAGLVRLELQDAGADMAIALAALAANPAVELAQRELRYRTAAGYDDPRSFLSYGPERIGALRLHARARGAGVRVAVIDSGVDPEHPELAGRIAGNVDTTGFGLSKDLHGTAVAGIIAAQENNGIGAYGVAPAATIVAIKACEAEAPGSAAARCWSSTVARALDRAIADDAQIINLSLGGPRDALIERLVARASADRRIVIAAAGNGGPDSLPAFPAAMEEVLAVTAVDAADALYSSATRGDFVDVAAPGVQIVVADPEQNYPVLSGTSMATAAASGASALLFELYPDLSAPRLRETLESTALDVGDAGRDPSFGSGVLDACAAAARLAGEGAEAPCSEPE